MPLMFNNRPCRLLGCPIKSGNDTHGIARQCPTPVFPAKAGIHWHSRMNRSPRVYFLVIRKHVTLYLSPRAWPLDHRVKPGDDGERGEERQTNLVMPGRDPVMTWRGGVKTLPPYSSCPDEDPGIQ